MFAQAFFFVFLLFLIFKNKKSVSIYLTLLTTLEHIIRRHLAHRTSRPRPRLGIRPWGLDLIQTIPQRSCDHILIGQCWPLVGPGAELALGTLLGLGASSSRKEVTAGRLAPTSGLERRSKDRTGWGISVLGRDEHRLEPAVLEGAAGGRELNRGIEAALVGTDGEVANLANWSGGKGCCSNTGQSD